MTECPCLQMKVVFAVYLKPTHFWHKLPFSIRTLPIETKTIVIHGDTLKELNEKKEEIKKEILSNYDDTYEISTGVLE